MQPEPLPNGWGYVPHGAREQTQVYVPLIGGPNDGQEVYVGSHDELANYVTRHTRHAVHYYGLAHMRRRWVYVHHSVQARR
jgi:hypothetical protein